MTNDINNMATKTQDDVALQRIRTKLVRMMFLSIIITFILVGLVLAAIVYKIMVPSGTLSDSDVSTQQIGEQHIDLQLDGDIISYRLAGDVVAIHAKVRGRHPASSDEFIFYDYRQGRILSRLNFSSPSK